MAATRKTRKPPAARVRAKAAPKRMAAPARGKVRLLSGGNPQIPKGEGDAPVKAYIAAMPGWKSAVGKRIDALVGKTVPGVRKAVKWNSPFYGLPGQGWFLAMHVFTRYIKLTFFKGTSLDPIPPGTSKHPEVRYLDLHEEGAFDEARLRRWIGQAAAIPGWSTGKD
ncbi:MAG: DUF1801 domain-containing protein [Myxococcales bacterium]|nr:DUF1801 domain-containing protein [Myxococcales bacterium]